MMATERRPLLTDEYSDEESFESFTVPSLQNRAWPVRIFKRGQFFPFSIGLWIILFGIYSTVDNFQESMRRLEASECSDVMADCEDVPFNETLVPPYYDYLQDFTIAPRYDISLCLIPKVMSTIGTATFCYLDDPEAFTKANRTIAKECYKQRFCEENEMKSFEMVKHKLHGKVENIVIARDPFDRFISGFTEKCVRSVDKDFCHGCGTDIVCFLQRQYRRLRRMAMLFPVYTLADTHFAPQTWFCDMKNTLRNSTLINYSNTGKARTKMIDDFEKVFRKRNVPEKYIDEVRKELSKGKSHHSTAGSKLRMKYENLIRENTAIRRAIVRLYYYDFIVLGYDQLSIETISEEN